MIRNYFIIAWRNLWRNKIFSAINIAGLTLGVTCSLLILLWVHYQYSYDAFLPNCDRLYTIIERERADGHVTAGRITPAPLGDELARVVPGVDHAVSYSWDHFIAGVGMKVQREEGLSSGKDFFQVLGFPLLRGQAGTALQGPRSIALSKKMAAYFFGSPATAWGKVINYDGTPFTVTAVFDDIPSNSSLQFDYVVTMSYRLGRDPGFGKWDNQSAQAVVLLSPGVDRGQWAAGIRPFLDKYYLNQGPGLREELDIQRYDEQYLFSDFDNGQVSGGLIGYVRLLSWVALFILLIAAVNFMNLMTARSAKRAKEIGVRKVAGALRRSLVGQFLGESLLLTFIAVGLALLLIDVALPFFNQLMQTRIVFPSGSPLFWAEVFCLGLLTGCGAGLYPALFLSSFQPVRVLKGTFSLPGNVVGFRRGLVVFQFVLSIGLVVGALQVSRQLRYMQTLDLGYNRDQLLLLPEEGKLAERVDIFKRSVLELPGVSAVSEMNFSPSGIGNFMDDIKWEGRNPNDRPTFAVAFAGYDLTRTLQLQVIRGRDFSGAYPTDTTGFLVNETAAARMGFTDPIGKRLALETGQEGRIIGVLKDFHFSSLEDRIDPLIIAYSRGGGGNLLVRIRPGKAVSVLAGLRAITGKLNPGIPFSSRFADEEYEKLYTAEKIIGRLGDCFAGLAIFISCLGLLGLALFTTQQRTREIGIRKVLGAGVWRIYRLLSLEFLSLVGIAVVISTPLSAWAVWSWQLDYAYRAGLSWQIFVLAGLLALAVALATISYLIIRAALTNPVKNLRTE